MEEHLRSFDTVYLDNLSSEYVSNCSTRSEMAVRNPELSTNVFLSVHPNIANHFKRSHCRSAYYSLYVSGCTWITCTSSVANPDNVYLALVMDARDRGPCFLYGHTNIRSLHDLLQCDIVLTATARKSLVDFSSYNGDPDADLDPNAFSDLLKTYHRLEQ